nr:hypothetical protein [Calditrichia bacterium]
MTHIALFAVVLIFLLLPPAVAQTPISAPFQLELQKDYVSWTWKGILEREFATAGQGRLSLSNNFQSNLYLQSSPRDIWRDQNTFQLRWERPLSSRLSTATWVYSRFFADDNTGREFIQNDAAQALTIRVHPKIKLTPSLGWSMENAFDNRDQGWYTRNSLNISRLDMGGYVNSTTLSSQVRAFPGRTNQEHTAFTGWSKTFSQYAGDSVRVGYQFSESNNVLGAANLAGETLLEGVQINTGFVFNQLNYRFSDRSVMAVITDFKQRKLEQSTPASGTESSLSGDREVRIRQELSLSNQFQHLWIARRWQIQSGVMLSQTDNNNDPGIETDITTLQTAFNLNVAYQPGAASRYWSQLSYTKLEYNAPASSVPAIRNLQGDRDELRFIIDSGFRRRLSEYLSYSLSANVYLFHQVFIRTGRSQNNNWNRIYQLKSEIEHRLSERVSHRPVLKLLANYTVFDFDEQFPQARSFVFRKFIAGDSLEIGLSRSLSFNGQYQGELED